MSLPKASCEACRKITHRFEAAVAVATEDVRSQWKMPSRKKSWKKRFAGGLANPFKIGDPNAAPGGFSPLALPIYPIPGLVSGVRHSRASLSIEGLSISSASFINGAPETPNHQIKVPAGKFARMLAKIGYSFTVARAGLHLTPQDLRPHILSNTTAINDVIGACSYPIQSAPQEIGPDEGGKLSLEPLQIGHGILRRDQPLLMVHFQPFRHMNAPTYWIVIGPARPEHEALQRIDPDAPTLRP